MQPGPNVRGRQAVGYVKDLTNQQEHLYSVLNQWKYQLADCLEDGGSLMLGVG
ncbi:hypothetical protein GKQ77_00720 [Streptomyces sp. BG9H]|uniref:Uncharacterized protein n=1 Tax=Streptomyces anatolicus TaxID=2675858 RepID=A0ABS6YFB9_9ACTN|nr:hypothetical protein [Streptomyces anatolicus]MBW5420103.1 hypothetical protein [Streptomyces anatolicus]